MKDKEKQIEEMAKDLEEVETDVGHILVNETFSYVKEHKKYNPKKDFSNAHTKTFEELTAEEMFKKGYQKVDKNKQVVLTKEEYEKLKNNQMPLDPVVLTMKQYLDINHKAYFKSKETAREILNDIYRYNGSLFGTCFHKGHYVSDVRDLVKDIAEEYGVEIKE